MEATREHQRIGQNVLGTGKYRLWEPSAFASLHSACSLATPSGPTLVFTSFKGHVAKPAGILRTTLK